MRPIALLSLLALVGCGQSPETCVNNGLPISTEAGVLDSCDDYGQQTHDLRLLFVEALGQVSLAGWTVRVAVNDAPYADGSGGYWGWTDWNTSTILVSQLHIHQVFAHELFHVQLGPPSASHAESQWCSELSPWEIQQGQEDERAYLRCR